MFCREQAAQYTGIADQITAKGARLVFLGNGTPYFAKGFQAEHAPGQTVLSDPKRNAYRATKMNKGLAKTLGPRSMAYGVKTLAKGFRQGTTQGVGGQQGGVLVIGPGDVEHYLFRSDVAGHHPDPLDVLAAVPSSA